MELKIEQMGINFEGVTHHEGKVCFAPGAVDGDVAMAEIAQQKPNYFVLDVKKIITPSTFRTKPKCPHFFDCGGCDCEHVCYDHQLKVKVSNVASTIKKIAKLDVNIKKITPSEHQYGYRNKVCFFVQNGKIGLKKKSSNQLVETHKCLLANDQINNVLNLIRQTVKIPPSLSHIVLRNHNNQVLVTFVVNKKTHNLNLSNFLSQLNPDLFGVYININSKQNGQIFGKNFVHVFGKKTIDVTFDEMQFEIGPESFFQINFDVCKKLYGAAAQLCDGENVFECYSGTSILGAQIAKKAKHVCGIEVCGEACRLAKQHLALNNIKNVEVVCQKVEDCLPNLITCHSSKKTTVLLDPPKAGCNKKVIDCLLSALPQKIVYISCSPQTLARDIAMLKSSYAITHLSVFDMFPQTKHIESLVCLEKI